MHPADIKAAIEKKGKNMTQLSLAWGFGDSTLRNALRQPMPRVEPKLAKYLDIPLHVLFPDRYDHENIRIYPINKIKSKAKKRRSHCKKLTSQFTSTKNGEKS